ncbi:MAG: hypothetical protein Q9209_002626 [Squamulea sp. 1 TL-2023]
MLIGLCGTILAGKQSVAAYLVECQGFSRLHLAPPNSTARASSFADAFDYRELPSPAKGSKLKCFDKVEELVDHITKRWQQRWVVTDIWDEVVLEKLLRRPSFFLNSGLARLIDRAEVRLLNRSDDRKQLHQTLEELDLPNEERLRPNWDQYFMQLASLAAQRSNCMKRRVGSVLVREKRVISTGYNGTPRNLKNCNEGGCECFGITVEARS